VDIIKATKNIEVVDLNFKNSFVRKVADGANTSFWLDPWCGDGSRLKDKFPRLYALDSFKECKLKDRVKTLSKVIENSLLGVHSLGLHHKWNSWIPRKVNVLVWKASLDRLATRLNLTTRGVDIPSPACPFYESDFEDIGHVLVKCPKVSVNEDIFPRIQQMAKLWISASIPSKMKTDWVCWIARPWELFS
ncbi:RNA-directed DNA polymerase, eukaryota, reverse transcriptase zinc-binding domain protein, partial [Tanacetum coccineum]